MSGDLMEKLRSHMGIADMGEVLRDCRAAADRIEGLEAVQVLLRSGWMPKTSGIAHLRPMRALPRAVKECASLSEPSPLRRREARDGREAPCRDGRRHRSSGVWQVWHLQRNRDRSQSDRRSRHVEERR